MHAITAHARLSTRQFFELAGGATGMGAELDEVTQILEANPYRAATLLPATAT